MITEKKKNINIQKDIDIALEMCEDWKPQKYWGSKDINMIWFTEEQLRKFIRAIKEEA
uniref:hypothetical protein n=1 Tax=uncultured Dysgonomonas sp. TaxID=206096 RepID=UPI0026205506|nr:hypothetical protein [uncultured Dysgonomonas sp.]